MHPPDHPRRSFVALGLAGDAGVGQNNLKNKEKAMKKIAIVISSIFFVSFCAGLGNTSDYERGDKGEYYEHSKRYENKFYGTVQQLPENLVGVWIIDGKNIQVTQGTYIERAYGQPGVGSYVEVEGRYTDNTFIARKIEVKGKREYERRERGEYYKQGERYENKFYGTVQQLPEDLIGIWLIDGKYIHVTKDTYIEREYGQPGVGSYVEVEGRYTENTFIARKIEVKRKHK